MKKNVFRAILLALMLFTACGNSGTPSLADQMVGDYKGTFSNQSGTLTDYYITVTKVADEEIQIAPTNGSGSSTFTAALTESTVGSITTITMISSDDILATNGTFVASTGRLSYTFHLGGDDDTNLEVFIGDKQ